MHMTEQLQLEVQREHPDNIVAKIVGHEVKHGTLYMMCRWKGFTAEMDTAQEAKELFKSCSARIAEYYKAEKTKKDKALNDFMQEYFPSLEHETEVEQRRKQPGDVASGKRKRQRVQGRTIAQAKKAQEKANQNKKKSAAEGSAKANKEEKSEVMTQPDPKQKAEEARKSRDERAKRRREAMETPEAAPAVAEAEEALSLIHI